MINVMKRRRGLLTWIALAGIGLCGCPYETESPVELGPQKGSGGVPPEVGKSDMEPTYPTPPPEPVPGQAGEEVSGSPALPDLERLRLARESRRASDRDKPGLALRRTMR